LSFLLDPISIFKKSGNLSEKLAFLKFIPVIPSPSPLIAKEIAEFTST